MPSLLLGAVAWASFASKDCIMIERLVFNFRGAPGSKNCSVQEKMEYFKGDLRNKYGEGSFSPTTIDTYNEEPKLVPKDISRQLVSSV